MSRTHRQRSAALLLSLACFAPLVGCGAAHQHTAATATAAPAGDAAALPESAVCPVMKHSFKPTAETRTAEYKGKTYYFCCPGCDTKFAEDPAKYVEE
ncbi:MAG: hypothetical protein RIT45_58 [Pseudomonadota bacterium]|jgi:Cu+-exporting ATPase